MSLKDRIFRDLKFALCNQKAKRRSLSISNSYLAESCKLAAENRLKEHISSETTNIREEEIQNTTLNPKSNENMEIGKNIKVSIVLNKNKAYATNSKKNDESNCEHYAKSVKAGRNLTFFAPSELPTSSSASVNNSKIFIKS